MHCGDNLSRKWSSSKSKYLRTHNPNGTKERHCWVTQWHQWSRHLSQQSTTVGFPKSVQHGNRWPKTKARLPTIVHWSVSTNFTSRTLPRTSRLLQRCFLTSSSTLRNKHLKSIINAWAIRMNRLIKGSKITWNRRKRTSLMLTGSWMKWEMWKCWKTCRCRWWKSWSRVRTRERVRIWRKTLTSWQMHTSRRQLERQRGKFFHSFWQHSTQSWYQ